MQNRYRGFIIEILPEAGELVMKAKRLDGSLVDDENNPSYYDNEEEALDAGQAIIDTLLDYF